MLLVDHGKPEIAKGDALLEQGVGADDDVDLARCELGQSLAALGALSRPVVSARRRPAASASGRMRSKCWRARISVGAISAA